MYLHFEDWTQAFFLNQIERNGLAHGGRIFKVFASKTPQSARYNKQQLVEIESRHDPFSQDEVFAYDGNRSFSGDELEADLAKRDLDDSAKDVVRALLRFASREDTGFCQAAMNSKRDGVWQFSHPFEDIDGLDRASQHHGNSEDLIHLDIFFPESLRRLKRIVDFDNPEFIITGIEAVRVRRAEGSLRNHSVET